MTKPSSDANKDKRIKILENLLAKEIDKVASLLKENLKLGAELEETKKQRDCWKKIYRKIKPDKRVSCDRQKAMIEYGEIDISEVVGSK